MGRSERQAKQDVIAVNDPDLPGSMGRSGNGTQPETPAEERVRGIGDFDLLRLFGSCVGDLGVRVLERGSKLLNRSGL
jgi:hypothetical protein